MRRQLALLMAGVSVLAGGLGLVSCGEDEERTTATTIPGTLTDTTTTTETAPKRREATVIRITVENAAPRGGIVRETVRKGDSVVLVVTSDASDHVHLHGYDVVREVAPGRPARLPFEATIPGRFEVELEDRGVPIADVTVTP